MRGSISSPAIPRRAAHCVHRVTVPSPSTQRDTSTPAATAAAATVRAWLQASGRSTPDVTEITRVRMAAGYAGGRAASSAVARGAAGGGHPRRHRRIGTCSRSRGSSSGCWSLRPCRSAGSPATSSTSSTRASADVPFAIPEGLAPEVYPLAWLVGRWEGEGVIVYPTVPECPVRQEVVVDHDGGPYLTWSSTLWLTGAGGAVWATESGYWRRPPDRPEELFTDQHLVELLHLGVVTVTGPDRLTWLHNITSQDLAGLAPRTSTETLVLSPYGHIEHAAGVVDDGERTWLLTEAASAPALAAWLDSMRFMMRVEVADVTAEWAALGEPVDAEGGEGEPVTWRDPWPRVLPGGTRYGPAEEVHPGIERPWRVVLVPRADLPDAVGSCEAAGWRLVRDRAVVDVGGE